MPRFDFDFSDEGVRRPTVDAKIYPGEVTGCKVTTAKAQFGDKAGLSGESTLFVWEVTISEPGPAFGHKLQHLSNTNDKAFKEDGTLDPTTGQPRLVPDPDAARTSNYYMRENWLKPLRAPWDKAGFSTDDVIHCRGKFKVTKVTNKDGNREFNRIEGVFPADDADQPLS